MSGHRQAAVTPSGDREKRPCGRPCGPLRSRRAALVMRHITADHAPGLKNPQGRQMCHPSMKVNTRLPGALFFHGAGRDMVEDEALPVTIGREHDGAPLVPDLAAGHAKVIPSRRQSLRQVPMSLMPWP